jgi:hypothetical protein
MTMTCAKYRGSEYLELRVYHYGVVLKSTGTTSKGKMYICTGEEHVGIYGE